MNERKIADFFHLGHVVRIATNDLSFCTIESNRTIYDHPGRDRPQFLKSAWYDTMDAEPGISSIRVPALHREVRKSLSHAFSAAGLRSQDHIARKYTDLFISQIEKLGHNPEGLDMTQVSFDINHMLHSSVNHVNSVVQLAYLRHYWRPYVWRVF